MQRKINHQNYFTVWNMAVSRICKWHSVPPVAQSTNGKHFWCKQTM